MAALGAGEPDRVARGGPWRVEPVEGDRIRIPVPDLLPFWLDVEALRDAAGAVTGLRVNSGRVRDVLYRRVNVAE